jgi:hypothetical protein
MAKQTSAGRPEPSALEAAAIPRAVRCWEAEVENTRRLSTRVQLLLGLATGLLGVLFLPGRAATDRGPSGLRVLGLLYQSASTVLVFASLVVLLRPLARRPARPSAAHWLTWPVGERRDPRILTTEAARRIGWVAITDAASVLRTADSKKPRDIDRGQALLLGGLGVALLGFLLMTLAGTVRIPG